MHYVINLVLCTRVLFVELFDQNLGVVVHHQLKILKDAEVEGGRQQLPSSVPFLSAGRQQALVEPGPQKSEPTRNCSIIRLKINPIE
jgi:hypothetical protein